MDHHTTDCWVPDSTTGKFCVFKYVTFDYDLNMFYVMFSDESFLAEGGFGVVHKGILKDGQVVAVKQLKFGGSQADLDFCREVRVLSCAQHRNVVLLIGFCIESNLRILVYEYTCN